MSDTMNIPEDGSINTQEIGPEELTGAPETEARELKRHGEVLGMAMPAPDVKISVTQARAGQALRRAWRAFAFKPVEHVAFYLVFITANMVLPFLGLVYRLEALLAGMGRLSKEKSPAYGDVILPTKAREAYRVGVWKLISGVARTDVTVVVLFTVFTLFAMIPVAVLYPVSLTLFPSLMLLSADAAMLAWLPVAFVTIVVSGGMWVAMMTYARLLGHVPAAQLNSAVHLHLVVTTATTMRRHLGFVVKSALIPAGLALGLGVVAGGLFALTSEFLPLSHIFLMTALLVPTLLAFVAFISAFSFQVAQTLAATVEVNEVVRYEGISLSGRLWGVIKNAWAALMSAGQTSYLVVFTFLAAAAVLVGALFKGLDSVSGTTIGALAVLVASFTALAALNARKGEEG